MNTTRTTQDEEREKREEAFKRLIGLFVRTTVKEERTRYNYMFFPVFYLLFVYWFAMRQLELPTLEFFIKQVTSVIAPLHLLPVGEKGTVVLIDILCDLRSLTRAELASSSVSFPLFPLVSSLYPDDSKLVVGSERRKLKRVVRPTTSQLYLTEEGDTLPLQKQDKKDEDVESQ